MFVGADAFSFVKDETGGADLLVGNTVDAADKLVALILVLVIEDAIGPVAPWVNSLLAFLCMRTKKFK